MMKRKLILFAGALTMVVMVKASGFFSFEGTDDFCLQTLPQIQIGVCNTKEGMPAEGGTGTVTVKWCESDDGPGKKNCSGNAIIPQIG